MDDTVGGQIGGQGTDPRAERPSAGESDAGGGGTSTEARLRELLQRARRRGKAGELIPPVPDNAPAPPRPWADTDRDVEEAERRADGERGRDA